MRNFLNEKPTTPPIRKRAPSLGRDRRAKRCWGDRASFYVCSDSDLISVSLKIAAKPPPSFRIPHSSFDPRHPDTPRVHSDCDLLPVLSIFGHELHGIPRFVHRPSKTIFPEQHMYPPRTINISRQCAARLYIPISLR